MFDVLIAGGGPAGLLLAVKIAPHLRVAILEKGQVGDTQKFWITTRERLRRHDLEHCIQFESNRGVVKTFLGPPAFASGNHAVVNDTALLASLKERAIGNGASIFEHSELVSLDWKDSKIVAGIHTGERLSARYLIDATGGSSPVVASLGISRIEGFYSVYGAYLENIDLVTTDIIGADVIYLGSPAPILEVIPTGRDSAHCVIFTIGRRATQPERLRAEFERNCRLNPYFRTTSGTVSSPKFGVIPIGTQRKKWPPRIGLFGESALIQPALLGTAFNEVVLQVDDFASQILQAAARDQVRIDPPTRTISQTLNDWIQLKLAMRILDGSAADIEWIAEAIRQMGPQVAYRLFLSEMRWAELIKVASKLVLVRSSSQPRK